MARRIPHLRRVPRPAPRSRRAGGPTLRLPEPAGPQLRGGGPARRGGGLARPVPIPRPRAWASTFGADWSTSRSQLLPEGAEHQPLRVGQASGATPADRPPPQREHQTRGASPWTSSNPTSSRCYERRLPPSPPSSVTSTTCKKAHADERTDELWNAVAEPGFLGVNVPEEYGGGGGGIAELATVPGGTGRRRLSPPGHRGLAGHLRHHHRQVRHRGPEAAVAPTVRHRRAQDGLRHHRARRRVQLPQPVADRHQGRRHLPSQRLEVLHLGRRRVRGRPGGDPVRGRSRHRPGPALAVRGGHRHAGTGQAGAAGGDHRRRRSSTPCSSTTSRSRPTDCSAPKARACARSSSD